MICPPDQISSDTLFDGRLSCRQYSNGYRFSLDSLLVAHFCRPAPGDSILDLGCGSGIIGLILAYRHARLNLVGLEFQPELAELASSNVRDNGFGARYSIIQGDLRNIPQLLEPESFDQVVCNPPYREPGTGRLSPTDQRARARHEIDSSLNDIVQAAAFAVKNRGRVILVYPAKRASSLISALRWKNLEPKRLQPVYSYPESGEATLVLVEAVKNGGEEVALLAPFFIYAYRNGPYSEAMQEIYR